MAALHHCYCLLWARSACLYAWTVFIYCVMHLIYICSCACVCQTTASRRDNIPFLTRVPVFVDRLPTFSRKHGVSPRDSLGLKSWPSSGEMAWSMWGQSSLASAALAASPFTLGSSNTQAHVKTTCSHGNTPRLMQARMKEGNGKPSLWHGCKSVRYACIY